MDLAKIPNLRNSLGPAHPQHLFDLCGYVACGFITENRCPACLRVRIRARIKATFENSDPPPVCSILSSPSQLRSLDKAMALTLAFSRSIHCPPAIQSRPCSPRVRCSTPRVFACCSSGWFIPNLAFHRASLLPCLIPRCPIYRSNEVAKGARLHLGCHCHKLLRHRAIAGRGRPQ